MSKIWEDIKIEERINCVCALMSNANLSVNEAMEMVGIVGNVYSNNDLEKIDEAISKIIYEKSPYYVFEKAFSMGFNSDIAIYFSDKEPDEPFFVETNELTYDDIEF